MSFSVIRISAFESPESWSVCFCEPDPKCLAKVFVPMPFL